MARLLTKSGLPFWMSGLSIRRQLSCTTRMRKICGIKFILMSPFLPVGEVFEDGRIWWKWRVPFKHAWTFYNSFESDPTDTTLNLYARPEMHKVGVVDMDTVQKIMDGDVTIEDLHVHSCFSSTPSSPNLPLTIPRRPCLGDVPKSMIQRMASIDRDIVPNPFSCDPVEPCPVVKQTMEVSVPS